MVRVLAGLVARGKQFGPQALSLSPCGRRIAFVGPTEFTVTVADARCLDEVRVCMCEVKVCLDNESFVRCYKNVFFNFHIICIFLDGKPTYFTLSLKNSRD